MLRTKTKRGGNGIRKEVKEEVKREMSGMKFKGSNHAAARFAEQLQTKASGGVDVGYLKTVLFPELYNADVPQPLSTQSYTRFSDKKEISIKSEGQGTLIWYPKTICGPQLFYKPGVPTDQKPMTAWKMGGYQDYSAYFTQANLVSASIQIQYIGQLQNEQGYFVGSQIFGQDPAIVTQDDIENGQFRLMEKPGDGVRMVYLPKDSTDFNYYPVDKDGTPNKYARNSGARPITNTFKPIAVGVEQTAGMFLEGVIPQALPTTVNANKYYSSIDISYATDADFIAIYWKGLFANNASEDLRIDIIRKFNGFPLAKHRDVLDLQKPKKTFDPKRTIDVISELQDSIPQLCGHSIKAMDRVSDEIQEFLPNVGHLYNEGMLKEGTTLRGFADQLQAVNGMEGQVVIPGRLYD